MISYIITTLLVTSFYLRMQALISTNTNKKLDSNPDCYVDVTSLLVFIQEEKKLASKM